MVQLMILSVLVEQKATSPGMGMTLNEIVEEVNKSADFDYSPVTIKRKVWALRDKDVHHPALSGGAPYQHHIHRCEIPGCPCIPFLLKHQ